jgi:hypothetical protein
MNAHSDSKMVRKPPAVCSVIGCLPGVRPNPSNTAARLAGKSSDRRK